MFAGVLPAVMVAAAGILAWALTGWFRQYAIKRGMVDVPNARSSHKVATPRGGGGGLVVATTLALTWWAWTTGSPALNGVLAGSLIAASIGFLDDHRSVPPIIRLIGHSLAAVVAVASIVTTSPGIIGGGTALEIAGLVVAVVFVAWLINLTNFMDGIDGIAGVEALTVCVSAAALSVVVAPASGLWFEPAVLGAAALGYLFWNWPPARVFMGDIGSGFIGYLIAALTLRSAAAVPELGWIWVILSGVFIVDATVTLARRAARGDRLFQAHRSHAYQHLALVRGHRYVTLLVAAINLFWLTPVAVLVALGILSGLLGVIVAYVPLAAGAVWLGAGSIRRP
jgi:Fuc2NAc and GlcNAc transferase